MYPPQAPWTGLGQLEREVTDVKSNLQGKANSYEVRSLESRLDSLAHAVRELSSALDGISSRLRQVEENQLNQNCNY